MIIARGNSSSSGRGGRRPFFRAVQGLGSLIVQTRPTICRRVWRPLDGALGQIERQGEKSFQGALQQHRCAGCLEARAPTVIYLDTQKYPIKQRTTFESSRARHETKECTLSGIGFRKAGQRAVSFLSQDYRAPTIIAAPVLQVQNV